jgi:hypothetical protein
MILPFPFYGIALYVLFARQKKQLLDPMRIRVRGNSVASSIANGISPQRSLSIETRLLIPCIINTVLFVVGQVSINFKNQVKSKFKIEHHPRVQHSRKSLNDTHFRFKKKLKI